MKAGSAGNSNTGFSTVEIMIALAILTLTISAVIIVVFGNQSLAIDTQTNVEAVAKAQTLVENARANAQTNFYAVVDDSDTEMSGSLEYAKTLTVSDPDVFTKVVEGIVSWQMGGRDLSVSFTTVLTNPEAVKTGETCNPNLTGDWALPDKFGTADVGQNNGATDVDTYNRKSYITTAASDKKKPDFHIVDVSDPEENDLPIYPGAINTGDGLVAVQVMSNYAFVASLDSAELYVINVSDPEAPFVVTTATQDVSTDAKGNTVFYFDEKLYLGLTKSTSGPELYVFDATDPENLIEVASYEVNSQVNSIRVREGVAYLAVPDDPATVGVSEQLKILDVSAADAGDIDSITEWGANPSTMSGQGLHLSVDSDELFIGMQGANPGGFPEFYWLDVSNPDSPDVIDSVVIGASVRAIATRQNLAFLWTSKPNLGFQVWDLDDLDEIYGFLNTQQNATGGFDCEGDYVYTGQSAQDALQVIGPTP